MSENEIDQPQKRKVSWRLLLGIIVFPAIFVWFTFRKGHTAKSRVFAMIWLLVAFVLTIAMNSLDRDIDKIYGTSDDSATMEVIFGGEGCKDLSYPVEVKITNNSDRDITRYSWSFEVRAKGHSTDLSVSPSSSSDLILKPNMTGSFCQPIPDLAANQYSLDDLEFIPGYVSIDASGPMD